MTGPPPAGRAIPALPSRDLVRTWKFYRYFGFEPVGPEPREGDSWLRLRRGEMEIDFISPAWISRRTSIVPAAMSA